MIYFLKKLNLQLSYKPAIPLLRICPREMKTCVHTKTWMQMWIAAYLITPKNSLVPLLKVHSSPYLLHDNHWFAPYHYSFLFSRISYKQNYILFSLLRMVFLVYHKILRFIHVISWIISFFCCWVVFIKWTYCNLFIHSTVDGHLYCF